MVDPEDVPVANEDQKAAYGRTDTMDEATGGSRRTEEIAKTL